MNLLEGKEGVPIVLLAFRGVFDPTPAPAPAPECECESEVSVGEGKLGEVADCGDRIEWAESEVRVFDSGIVGTRGEAPLTNEPNGEGGTAGDEGRRVAWALGEDGPWSAPDLIGFESEDDDPFLGAGAGAERDGNDAVAVADVVSSRPALELVLPDGSDTTFADFGERAVLMAGGAGGFSLSFFPLPMALATVAPKDRDRARGNRPWEVAGLSAFFFLLSLGTGGTGGTGGAGSGLGTLEGMGGVV